MSLTSVNKWKVIRSLLQLKLKAHVSLFTALIIAQVFAILFSLNGSAHGGSGALGITFSYFSGDIIIAFTFVWLFISSILITTKVNNNVDFLFVTTRRISQITNLIFLAVMSLIGALSAQLATLFIQGINLFMTDIDVVSNPQTFSNLLLSIGSIVLYLFLFALIGYFIGMLVQLHKLFFILVPAIFGGGIAVAVLRDSVFNIMLVSFQFFTQESIFILFVIKVLLAVAVLFTGAFLIGNRLEVQK